MPVHGGQGTGQRGRFITFEGPEGAGKTTQMRRAAEALSARGVPICCTREPGGDPVAEGVRSVLLQPGAEVLPRTELLLFLAARAQVVGRVIQPRLAAGDTVLCDRYADSTMAYQAYGRGLPVEDVRRMIAFATGGLQPDLTILLDIAPDLGLARQGDANRMEAEPLNFHQRVRDGYLAEAALDPGRVRIIDAGGTFDAVHDAVMAAIDGAQCRTAREGHEP